jgi:hypothetical protein
MAWRSRLALCAAIWLSLLATAPAAAASGPLIQAELEGTPIPASDVGKYYCHDLAFPLITCFSRAAPLEASLADSQSAASIYVTVYSDASYTGAYAHLSEDYDGLWTIGWNDRVSSFVGRNGESGRFFTDWYEGGDRYDFCCDAEVPYLDSFDDTFSSAYRTT